MHKPADPYDEIREAIAKLCARFPGSYWRALDREMAYPKEFVAALTQAGWLGALVPEEYGGSGLPLSAGAAILEEIHKSGGECGGLPCTDVHNGHAPASWIRAAKTPIPT